MTKAYGYIDAKIFDILATRAPGVLGQKDIFTDDTDRQRFLQLLEQLPH